MLSPKVVLTIVGDAGGGGSKLDYQVVRLLGYKVKKVTLEAEWWYLTIHDKPTGRTFVDVNMTGVVFASVIPLK